MAVDLGVDRHSVNIVVGRGRASIYDCHKRREIVMKVKKIIFPLLVVALLPLLLSGCLLQPPPMPEVPPPTPEQTQNGDDQAEYTVQLPMVGAPDLESAETETPPQQETAAYPVETEDAQPAEAAPDLVSQEESVDSSAENSADSAPSTICDTPGEIVQTSFGSNLTGQQTNVRVYLPPCYATAARVFPTLYLIHGNNGADEQWDEYGIDEAANRLILAGEIAPMIIVLPDGRPLTDVTSGGPGSFEDLFLNELVPFIEDGYCADRNTVHRAIGGLSRGGYWAFEIAFRHPQLFASAGGHAPAFLDTGNDPAINPIYTALSADLSTLRIVMDFGANDYLLPTAQAVHDQMTASNVSHEWIVHETGEHEDPYWRNHVESYLRWYSTYWSKNNADYFACDTISNQ